MKKADFISVREGPTLSGVELSITPFGIAVLYGSLNVMKLMIEKGVDIDACIPHMEPLTYLLLDKRLSMDCIKLLLINGVSVNYEFKFTNFEIHTVADFALGARPVCGEWIIIAGGHFVNCSDASIRVIAESMKLDNISQLTGEKLLNAIQLYFSETQSKTTLRDKLNYFLIYSCRSHTK